MHASHRCRLVVDGAQQPRREVAIVDHLLLPLASQSRIDGVGGAGHVFGIDVATDAEGIEVPKAPLAGPSQAMREEVSVAMAKHDVGDDLWLGPVLPALAPSPDR